MFKSRFIDHSDNCNIIRQSLADDLLPFTIKDDETINYGNSSYAITSRITDLASLITTDTLNYEVWKPIFIDNDRFINTKMLSSYGAYLNGNLELSSGRIGIENFYKFKPEFKHWTASSDADMCIDWILNRSNTYHAIYYGILGWYRNIDIQNPRSDGDLLQTIDKFPVGSRLVSSSDSNKIYIKLDNNKVYNLSEGRTINNNEWVFTDENLKIIEVSSLGNDPKFKLSDIYYTYDVNLTTGIITKNIKKLDSLSLNGNIVHLWIPDGDYFGFFNTESEKKTALLKNIGANSYISSSLYRYYANIYRIITLDVPRSHGNKDLRVSRAYKRLAHSLSSSPFITDFSINALDYIEIRKIIQDYISKQVTITSISQDISILKTALTNISQVLQNNIVSRSTNIIDNRSLYLDNKPSFSNINNNLITNPSQLFTKLFNKYGTQLLINPSSNVKISPKIDQLNYDNQGIVITQVLDHYCDKGLQNTILQNEQAIKFDNVSIFAKGLLTNNNFDIAVDGEKKVSVPLADFAKPNFNSQNSSINITLKYAGSIPELNFSPKYTLPADINTYTYETYINSTNIGNLINDPYQRHALFLDNEGIELSALNIFADIYSMNEKGIMYEDIFLESKLFIIWEQIDGPEGRFASDNIGIPISGPTTTFYSAYTGRFTIQCTVITPFGTYKKQKTFYVIGGLQSENTSYKKYWDPESKQWLSPPSPNPYAYESEPISLNRDDLRIITSKINRIAINNINGVVWPIDTRLSIREDIGAIGRARSETIFELAGLYKFAYPNNYVSIKQKPELTLSFDSNNTSIKIHSLFLEKVRTPDPECMHCLSFYEPGMSSQQATRFRQNPIEGQPSETININRLSRTNKNPQEFTFIRYIFDSATNKAKFYDYNDFVYPLISTSSGPAIKSYGGYERGLIDSLGVDLPNHPKPNKNNIANTGTLVSDNPIILPNVTGYKLDYTNDKDQSLIKMCYQKILPITPGTGSIISFAKGTFHPNSGWMPYDSSSYQIHANKCGILKFNPGARDSFAFTGPAITQIKNASISINDNTIKGTLNTSIINLSLAKEIQWDPECICENTDPNNVNYSLQNYNANQKHKEYIDIDNNRSNHGYRILGGGIPKSPEFTANSSEAPTNDEFILSQTAANEVSYSFAVTGPSVVPEKVRLPDGKIQLRNPRVLDLGIKDIEIKLNFLNYVNPKNLIVWLEIGYDKSETRARFPPVVGGGARPSPLLKTKNEFIDQNTFISYILSNNQFRYTMGDTIKPIFNNQNIYDYLYSLTSMNCDDSKQPFRLFLLNQEHIQNNSYNFSVKFSDSASKYNTLYDLNIQPSPTGDLLVSDSDNIMSYMVNNRLSYSDSYYSTSQSAINQNIIKSNDILQPTIAATGYTDRQTCLYHSILKHNKLNITNNTLSKFVSDSLFNGDMPETGPCEDGSPKQKDPAKNGITTFKLCMMVLDEIDDMNPADNINYQYKSGFDVVENKTQSSYINSSLCNWELILHVGPTHKPLPHTNPDLSSYGNNDVLSLIDYKEPEYPGYSFIADLSSYKHLLPLANYNAPYTSVADSTTCFEDFRDPTKFGSIIKPPEFPTSAIVQILSSIAQAAAFGGGTLVGTLAGLDGIINNPGYNALFNWFREVGFAQQLENAGRQIYSPNYSRYPFGSPEKILLNFRKPNALWYTAEATIFKYHNTPILKPNKYKFIRVKRGNGQYISEFKFNTVTDYTDLIDKHLIKSITQPCAEYSALISRTLPTEVGGIIIEDGDIVDINLITDQSAQPCTNGGLHIVYNNQSSPSWIKLLNNNSNELCKSIKFISHNAIINAGQEFFTSSFDQELKNNKVIIIDSRIPYDIFKVTDYIECYDFGDRLESRPPSLINNQILNKALIFKNNKYYSVFTLQDPITNQNTISAKPDSHIFFTFGNTTSIEDKINKAYNIWGFDYNKRLNNSTTPSMIPNVHSLGSYGDASPLINKNILSNNLNINSLQNNYSIFNNHLTDRVKYNKISITDISGVAITGFNHTKAYGFSYNERDFQRQIFDTKDLCYYITPEYLRQTEGDSTDLFAKLKDQIELSTTNTNDKSYRYSYIRTDASNATSALDINVVAGELSIENDLIEYIPIKLITQDLLSKIVNRLNIIDSTSYSDVDQEIGIPESTSLVLNSNNLNSILKHYEQLTNDPAACFRPNNTNQSICYKQKTEQKINQLYIERQEIIDLLDLQTIRLISFDYIDDSGQQRSVKDSEIIYENYSRITIKNGVINTLILKSAMIPNTIIRSFKLRSELSTNDPRFLDPKILPKISPEIIEDSKYNSLRIEYKPINTDYYWINLDPKQSTFKDFESNPKILIETKYTCTLANPIDILTPTINNNVCPFFIDSKKPDGKFPNIEEVYSQPSPGEIRYIIDPAIIEQKKREFQSKFPQIREWKKFTKERYFNINGDQTLDIAPALEITVRSEEDYYIPVTDEDNRIITNNDGSADSMSVVGIEACQTNSGSPGGYGLLNTYGDREGVPTRIINICNLDNTNNIEVCIKRIPRLLRGVDLLSTIYRYGFKSLYRQTNSASPRIPNDIDGIGIGGAINNSLYIWTCFQTDPKTQQLEKTALPPFFQLQNEMIFRAFFGSIDKIENRSESLSSGYAWELIPYEYTNSFV